MHIGLTLVLRSFALGFRVNFLPLIQRHLCLQFQAGRARECRIALKDGRAAEFLARSTSCQGPYEAAGSMNAGMGLV